MQLTDAGRPRSPGSAYVRVMFCVSVLVAVSCGEAPTSGDGMRRVDRPRLSLEAADAVALVLADVDARVADALEDGAARTQFAAALTAMNARLREGLLDQAESSAADARAALALAAGRDADGSGDADRAAIDLALEFANAEITNARRLAAGGTQ